MSRNDRSILLVSKLGSIDIAEIGSDCNKHFEEQRHHSHYMMPIALRDFAARVQKAFPTANLALMVAMVREVLGYTYTMIRHRYVWAG